MQTQPWSRTGMCYTPSFASGSCHLTGTWAWISAYPSAFCPPSILHTVIRFLTASIQPSGVSGALSQAAGAWYCRFPSNSSLQNYKEWVPWSITQRLVMHRGVMGELWTCAWVGPLARLLISEAQMERVLMQWRTVLTLCVLLNLLSQCASVLWGQSISSPAGRACT